MHDLQIFTTQPQRVEQLLERVAELQAAQARSIGRTDVHGDIAGVVVDLVQAEQIILIGALDGGVEILADVDPQHAFEPGRFDTSQQGIDTVVVEAHAIDDRLGFRQAEDSRLRVAGLRARRHGADLDEAETQLRQPANGLTILVQPRGQTYRVGKVQPHHPHWQAGRRLAKHRIQPETAARANQLEGKFVGSFRR